MCMVDETTYGADAFNWSGGFPVSHGDMLDRMILMPWG